MVREVPQLATVWEPWLDGACILKRMDQDPERFLLVLRQTPYSRRGLLRKTDFVHGFVVDIKHLLFDSLPFVSSDVLSSFRSRSPRLPLPRLHSPAARPRWYGSIIPDFGNKTPKIVLTLLERPRVYTEDAFDFHV